MLYKHLYNIYVKVYWQYSTYQLILWISFSFWHTENNQDLG